MILIGKCCFAMLSVDKGFTSGVCWRLGVEDGWFDEVDGFEKG